MALFLPAAFRTCALPVCPTATQRAQLAVAYQWTYRQTYMCTLIPDLETSCHAHRRGSVPMSGLDISLRLTGKDLNFIWQGSALGPPIPESHRNIGLRSPESHCKQGSRGANGYDWSGAFRGRFSEALAHPQTSTTILHTSHCSTARLSKDIAGCIVDEQHLSDICMTSLSCNYCN